MIFFLIKFWTLFRTDIAEFQNVSSIENRVKAYMVKVWLQSLIVSLKDAGSFIIVLWSLFLRNSHSGSRILRCRPQPGSLKKNSEIIWDLYRKNFVYLKERIIGDKKVRLSYKGPFKGTIKQYVWLCREQISYFFPRVGNHLNSKHILVKSNLYLKQRQARK